MAGAAIATVTGIVKVTRAPAQPRPPPWPLSADCPATPVAGGTGRLLPPTTGREGAEHTVLWQTLLGSHCPLLCLRGQVRMPRTHRQLQSLLCMVHPEKGEATPNAIGEA